MSNSKALLVVLLLQTVSVKAMTYEVVKKGSFYNLVKQDKKFGYVDRDGQVLLPIVYDEIRQESQRIVLVKDGKLGLLHIGGESMREVIPAEYDYIQSYQIYPFVVGKGGKFGIVDNRGKWLLPVEYDHIDETPVFPRLAKKNGKLGLVDSTGKGPVALIPFEYEELQSSADPSDSSYRAKKNGLWGMVDKSNHIQLPFQYSLVEGYFGGVLRVQKDGAFDYLDKANRSLGYYKQKDFKYSSSKTVRDAGFLSGPAAPLDSRVGASSQPGLQMFVFPEMVPYEFASANEGSDIKEFLGLVLVNSDSKPIHLHSQDGKLFVKQQAQVADGQWRTIENWVESDCGNSHIRMEIPPRSQIVTRGRRYRGDRKTKMRFKLTSEKTVVYSNSFEGSFDSKLLDSLKAE